MAGIDLELPDLRLDLDLLAHDPDLLCAVLQQPAERARRPIADEQDGVLRAPQLFGPWNMPQSTAIRACGVSSR
jgi:hypothetical protein